jgi:hypothetical protein
MTEIRTILYKQGEWIYGINTKNQFVVLKNFVQVSNIVTNINSDYAFCMDGSTLYLCTKCDGIRQILRFTLFGVPEPLFTDHNIPFITHMIFFKGYLCATTETEIYIYDVANNKHVVQPTWTNGTYQGIAGYQDSLYFKKNNMVLSIPFSNGLLDYSQATVTNQGPFALYFQVDNSVSYTNVLITVPLNQGSIQVGFDNTFIKTPTPYISLTENPTLYPFVTPFTYVVPYSYQDKVICGTICFLSGSMVLTDQGSIAIEYLIPNVHTIFRKKIIGISMTYSLEDTLVCIPKNAFAKHVPIRDTFLSNNHKIYHNGVLIEAEKMVGSRGVRSVLYDNQLLYNVILQDYGIMNVNNLICETLDPDNPAAKEFII